MNLLNGSEYFRMNLLMKVRVLNSDWNNVFEIFRENEMLTSFEAAKGFEVL